MNEIQIFNNPDFGEIRTVEIDGKDYFYGADVARALMYKRPNKAITDNCKGILSQDTLRNKGNYPEPLIPEGDIFRLVVKASMQSTSEDVRKKAEQFESWIFDEVLPALRSKGTYTMQSKSEVEVLKLHYNAIMEISEKTDRNKQDIDTVKAEINELKYDIPLFSADEKKLSNIVRRRASKCMGGSRSNAFKDKSLRRSVLQLIYGELHRQLDVTSCKFMKRGQFDTAVEIVKSWEPDIDMQDRIDMCNAQMCIFVK